MLASGNPWPASTKRRKRVTINAPSISSAPDWAQITDALNEEISNEMSALRK